MRVPKSFSITALFLLTTLVAMLLLAIERKRNPPVSVLFQTLLAKIPLSGQQRFLPPATQSQIDKAEEAIRRRIPDGRLPNSVKTLYRLCGGQPWDTRSETELFPFFVLNPIDNAITDYEETCQLYESILPIETKSFPETWYDYRLFPFGSSPNIGTLYCIDITTERIYNFNPDGGLMPMTHESIKDLLLDSIDFQRSEFGR